MAARSGFVALAVRARSYDGRVSVPRPLASTIPDEPGAYQFKDAQGRVVYVGKASSLRKRLASYWAKQQHPRTQSMLAQASTVEWIVASTEVDALMLEYNLIKEHEPRYNIRYRDDKSYPYLALTLGEQWPRAQVMRGTKRKGVRYFGPYGHAWAIRETLDALTRVFPVRTCSNGFFDQRARAQRPCLAFDIQRCAGPCVPERGGVTPEGYRELVDSMAAFLAGRPEPVLKRLQGEMDAASERQEYEAAARLRDQLAAARRAMESQEMVLGQEENLDVLAVSDDDLEAAFQVFFVRRGRVMGRRGWVVDKVDPLGPEALVGSLLSKLYMERDDIPATILVPVLPPELDAVRALLAERRGGPVTLAVPARGDKRRLMDIVTRNAADSFVRHKMKRASDFGARSRALADLGEHLGLVDAPLRIECFDISNLGATDKVASMVVFEDGLPKRNHYRRFQIKGVQGQDDFASMDEALRRRFSRLEADPSAAAVSHEVSDEVSHADADAPKVRSAFSYPPGLLVIDGGKGQLGVAVKVLEDLDVHIPVVGLAKRLEEVFVPGDPEPIIIPRGSDALFLLQHIRDEAHRFAVTYHRSMRAKRLTASPLDDIPGIGPSRKKALLRRFGSLKRLREASAEQIAETPGVGLQTAAAIHGALHGETR